MTGQLTQFGANRAVQAGLGLGVSATAAMYIALATAEPGTPDTATLADFAGNEISTAGYSRQAVDWDGPTGDPSEMANDDVILFGEFTADPPEVTHCFLTDTSTGTTGNVLAYWALDTARNASSGDYLRFATGELTLSVD